MPVAPWKPSTSVFFAPSLYHPLIPFWTLDIIGVYSFTHVQHLADTCRPSVPVALLTSNDIVQHRPTHS